MSKINTTIVNVFLKTRPCGCFAQINVFNRYTTSVLSNVAKWGTSVWSNVAKVSSTPVHENFCQILIIFIRQEWRTSVSTELKKNGGNQTKRKGTNMVEYPGPLAISVVHNILPPVYRPELNTSKSHGYWLSFPLANNW